MPVLLVDLETSVVNRFAFRIDPPPPRGHTVFDARTLTRRVPSKNLFKSLVPTCKESRFM